MESFEWCCKCCFSIKCFIIQKSLKIVLRSTYPHPPLSAALIPTVWTEQRAVIMRERERENCLLKDHLAKRSCVEASSGVVDSNLCKSWYWGRSRPQWSVQFLQRITNRKICVLFQNQSVTWWNQPHKE